MSTPVEKQLFSLLDSIFADDVVEVGERTRLLEFLSENTLAADSVHRVFGRFVEAKWGEAMADGRLTEREKLVLGRILEELELPQDRVPLQLRLALGR